MARYFCGDDFLSRASVTTIYHTTMIIMRLLRLLCFFFAIFPANGEEQRQLAFIQQDEADVVVSFWHWDSLSLVKPKKNGDLDKRALVQALDGIKKKNLIVVILDKRMAPRGKEVSADDLVQSFNDLGFRRVVVQLSAGRSHPTGLPILKDSMVK